MCLLFVIYIAYILFFIIFYIVSYHFWVQVPHLSYIYPNQLNTLSPQIYRIAKEMIK